MSGIRTAQVILSKFSPPHSTDLHTLKHQGGQQVSHSFPDGALQEAPAASRAAAAGLPDRVDPFSRVRHTRVLVNNIDACKRLVLLEDLSAGQVHFYSTFKTISADKSADRQQTITEQSEVQIPLHIHNKHKCN